MASPKPPYDYMFTLTLPFRKSALMLACRDDGFARAVLPRIPLGYFEGNLMVTEEGDVGGYTWIQDKLTKLIKSSGSLPTAKPLVNYLMHEASKELVRQTDTEKASILNILGHILKDLLTGEPDVPFSEIPKEITKGIQGFKLGEFLAWSKDTLESEFGELDTAEFDKRYYDAIHGVNQRLTHTSYRETYKAAIYDRDRLTRIPTGLPKLDKELLGGVGCGELAVLGAETGAGKTTLFAAFAAHALKEGHLAAYVTLETSGDNIKNMVSAAYSKITRNMLAMSKGKAEDRVTEVLDKAPAEADLLVLDAGPGGIGASGIRAWLESLRMAGSPVPTVVFVDYLNNMRMGNQKDQKYIAYRDEMTALAGIAHDFQIAVWVAAQLNREASTKRVPELSDFAGSWDMLNVPPTVLLFYYPDGEKNTSERHLKVEKTKSGSGQPVFRIIVDFGTTNFTESAIQPKERTTKAKITAPATKSFGAQAGEDDD